GWARREPDCRTQWSPSSRYISRQKTLRSLRSGSRVPTHPGLTSCPGCAGSPEPGDFRPAKFAPTWHPTSALERQASCCPREARESSATVPAEPLATGTNRDQSEVHTQLG